MDIPFDPVRRWLALQTAAVLCGFAIDFFAGDPHGLPHPVAGIGRLVSFCDGKLRCKDAGKKDVFRGAVTVALVTFVSTLIPALLLILAWKLRPAACFILDTVMCWQLIAARQLCREAGRVRRALEAGDTEAARRAVSMIVGRDTDSLAPSGICRAAVETVAENATDGITAPLFWIFLFGAPGGFFYKSVNTMDSMIGYKSQKYLYFGRAAARLDDIVNYLPARLTALLMTAACPLCGLDAKGAWKIFHRDRYKHASPNSAQTESVCAGALGVRLAGDAVYGGVLCKKEFIGDALREIEPKDIGRACRLAYGAAFGMLFLVALLRWAVILCL
ncbi:MAG: cobalamin biosynthesis protein CobD [Abditibacteriota bacterium]|nr:cobalamin biosynthesis protein CobD [Abditibacteriota bacterium]